MSKEFLIAGTLEPVNIGEALDTIPLHMTIMQWFKINESEYPALLSELESIADKFEPLHIIGDEEGMFGPNKDRRVRKISSLLVKPLHSQVLNTVNTRGAHIISPHYVDDQFVPHVTYEGGEGLEEGSITVLDAMQVISRDGRSPKIVEAIYRFRGLSNENQA